MSILELFCSVDDFWQQFAPTWHHELLTSGQRHRVRPTQLHPSEIMTILILFHQSHYRTFKAYYTEYVHRHLRSEFPTLVSYGRFVELMPTVLVPLVAYLHTQLGQCSGISFIDSTPLAVCHNARIHSHRVFDGRAARGKTSVDWFYGFKLHLVDRGLATSSTAIKDAMGVNTGVVADGKGSGVDEADAATLTQLCVQIGHQGHQHRGHQLDKTPIAHQGGKLAAQVTVDILGVVGFEGAIVRLVKQDQD